MPTTIATSDVTIQIIRGDGFKHRIPWYGGDVIWCGYEPDGRWCIYPFLDGTQPTNYIPYRKTEETERVDGFDVPVYRAEEE
jgi:hypothetical protein